LNRMFHKKRKLASLFYLGSLGVTLFLLMLPRFMFRGLLLFLLMIGQYIAITWYCLSYIPYAREFLSNCCRRLVQAADDD
jgi:Got1/Sft2-like family